tara:strand:+ start:163 stop:2229 length:2067 start_codon:yes stop_codon:yes gene_type:complete
LSQISKIVLSILIILTLSAAAGYAGLRYLLADPDRYREELAEQLASSTGYAVRFQSLEWQLWPDLAIRLDGIAIDPLLGDEPLAVIDTLAIDVKLLPLLLAGELTIDSIKMGAVKLHLFTDVNGQSNYQTTDAAQTPESPKTAATEANTTTGIALSSLTIETIAIHYADAAIIGAVEAEFRQVRGMLLDNQLNLVFENGLRYSDTDLGIAFDGETEGTIVYNIKANQIEFEVFSIQGDLATPIQGASTFEVELTGAYKVKEDAFAFEQMRIDHLGLTTRLTGAMTGVTEAKIRLDLNLSTTLNNADVFNTALANPLQGFTPITELALSTRVRGTDVTPEFFDIQGSFNGGTFNGEASIDLPNPAINLTLNLSALDLSVSESKEGNNGSLPSDPLDPDTILLPIAELGSASAKIELRIKTVKANEYVLSDVHLHLVNEQSILTTTLEGQLAAGTVQFEMASDYQQKAFTTLKTQLTQINLNQLYPNQTLGKLNLSSSLSFEGASLAGLSKTLKGKSQFALTEGLLDIRTVKQGAQWLDQMSQTQSGVADWPDDLVIDTLSGSHQFHAGLPIAQTATLNYENVTLDVSGGLDLFDTTFDYAVTMTLAAATQGPLPVKGPLTGTPWPAQCQGAFENLSPSVCRINRDKAQQLLTEIARKALKDKAKARLNQTIENKAPEALKDLLKGLLGS